MGKADGVEGFRLQCISGRRLLDITTRIRLRRKVCYYLSLSLVAPEQDTGYITITEFG